MMKLDDNEITYFERSDYELNKNNNMESKKWYQSKTILVAVLMGASGVVVAFETQFPALGWLMLVKAMIDVFLRMATTETIK